MIVFVKTSGKKVVLVDLPIILNVLTAFRRHLRCCPRRRHHYLRHRHRHRHQSRPFRSVASIPVIIPPPKKLA